MKVSIVTISLNQKEFLAQAIDSVLSQDYSDIEYIVVDPGSTDGSRELISSYGSRISHMVFTPDKGAADGLNHGFAQATGQIFAFLNSDDYLLPGAIRAVVDAFQAEPSIDLLMGDGLITEADGSILRHVRSSTFTPRRYLYGGTLWMQQSTFFKAEAFQRAGGFNIENRTCWDGELFLSIVLNGGKVGYLHKELAAFRLHSGSITGTGRLQQAYLADQHRIFAAVKGRQWSRMDHFRSYLCRTLRLLETPTELLSMLRYRQRRARA